MVKLGSYSNIFCTEMRGSFFDATKRKFKLIEETQLKQERTCFNFMTIFTKESLGLKSQKVNSKKKITSCFALEAIKDQSFYLIATSIVLYIEVHTYI